MAFFDIPALDFADFIYQRKIELSKQWPSRSPVTQIETGRALEEKLHQLLPLNSAGNRTLVCETKSNWSVYVTNEISGADIHSQPSYITKTLRIKSVAVTLVADTKDQPGSTQFVYRDGTQTKEIIAPQGSYSEFPSRSLAAHKESKWEFHEHGEPLPFEDLERYKEKRIKDRLTFDMVERYCAEFGISLFDPDFYSGYGRIIESKPWPNAVEMDHFPNA